MSEGYKYAIVRVFPPSSQSPWGSKNDLMGSLVSGVFYLFKLTFKAIHILFRIYIFKESISFKTTFFSYLDDLDKADADYYCPRIDYEIVGEIPRTKANSEAEIIAKLGADGYIIYDRKNESRPVGQYTSVNQAIYLRKKISLPR